MNFTQVKLVQIRDKYSSWIDWFLNCSFKKTIQFWAQELVRGPLKKYK